MVQRERCINQETNKISRSTHNLIATNNSRSSHRSPCFKPDLRSLWASPIVFCSSSAYVTFLSTLPPFGPLPRYVMAVLDPVAAVLDASRSNNMSAFSPFGGMVKVVRSRLCCRRLCCCQRCCASCRGCCRAHHWSQDLRFISYPGRAFGMRNQVVYTDGTDVRFRERRETVSSHICRYSDKSFKTSRHDTRSQQDQACVFRNNKPQTNTRHQEPSGTRLSLRLAVASTPHLGLGHYRSRSCHWV